MTTLACLTTGTGAAAIAVIEVVGPEAIAIVRKLTSQVSEEPKRAVLRHDGSRIDEAVVRAVPAARSFTGDPTVEVCCHGGQGVSARVLEVLVRCGAAPVGKKALIERALENGRIDSFQAEALELLPEAVTALAAMTLNDQARGALSRAWALGEDLMKTAPLGLALAQPPVVVIAGQPNVGKSTLFNALLERERAVVFDQAGTTRDPVRDVASIEGVPIRLIDTAGVADPRDELERASMERAVREAERADLVLWVDDSTGGGTREGPAGLKRVIRVWNKVDLDGADPPFEAVRTAAARRRGLDDLRREILERLGIVPSYVPGRAVVFTRRQVEMLKRGERP